jgi:hypothetical protein
MPDARNLRWTPAAPSMTDPQTTSTSELWETLEARLRRGYSGQAEHAALEALRTRMAQLSSEQKGLEQDRDDWKDTATDLRAEVEQLEQERDELRAKVEKQERQNEQLRRELDEANHLPLPETHVLLAKENNRLKSQVEQLKQERDEARAAVRKVKNLKPLYVRPSGGKDFHECHFIALAALGDNEKDVTTGVAATPTETVAASSAPVRGRGPGRRGQREAMSDLWKGWYRAHAETYRDRVEVIGWPDRPDLSRTFNGPFRRWRSRRWVARAMERALEDNEKP